MSSDTPKPPACPKCGHAEDIADKYFGVRCRICDWAKPAPPDRCDECGVVSAPGDDLHRGTCPRSMFQLKPNDTFAAKRDRAAEAACDEHNVGSQGFRMGADFGYAEGRVAMQAELERKASADLERLEAELASKTKDLETVHYAFDKLEEEVERLTAELAKEREEAHAFAVEANETLFKMKQDDWIEACKKIDRLKAELAKRQGEPDFDSVANRNERAEYAEECRNMSNEELARACGEPATLNDLLSKNGKPVDFFDEPTKCEHERIMTNGCCYFCGVDLNAKPASAASEAREWYINPICKYRCEVNEDGIGLTGNEIHVIEYSAYEKLRAELAEAKLPRNAHEAEAQASYQRLLTAAIEERNAAWTEVEVERKRVCHWRGEADRLAAALTRAKELVCAHAPGVREERLAEIEALERGDV